MRERQAIKAIHAMDLDRLLKALELQDDLETGKLQCHFCGRTVRPEDVVAVIPVDGRIAICCSLPNCYYSLTLKGAVKVGS